MNTSHTLPPSGTRVSDRASDKELYRGQDVSVKGFATIDNVVLINVEVSVCGGNLPHTFQGTGMVSVPGITSATFSLPHFPTPHTSQGTGMVGVPGIASAIFSTVRDANINVIMISQASSEQSICFAVKKEDGEQAVAVLEKR